HLLSEQSIRYHEMSTGTLSTSLLSAINKDQEHPLHYLYKRSANLGVANYPREELLPDKFTSEFFQRYNDLARDIMSNIVDVKEALIELEDLGNKLLSNESLQMVKKK